MKRNAHTTYWFMNVGEGLGSRPGCEDEIRQWEDCVQYGFMATGNGQRWIEKAKEVVPGDHLFAYVSGHGYVGYGIVEEAALPFNSFVPTGQRHALPQLPLHATATRERMQDPERWDMCIRVKWIKTLERTAAVKGIWASPQTLCHLKSEHDINSLLQVFDPAALRA